MAAYEMIARFRLDGTVSLVTGASRGLGRAIAEALAGAGSEVVVTGRQLETLQPVAASLSAATNRRILPVAMDVARQADIQRTVDTVMQEFGRVDVLVNNAGISQRLPALEFTEEAWDAVMAVDLKGAFFLTQACGKVMAAQRRGKIINILSLTTAWGLPTVVAYSAAKAGLAQLT